MKTWLDYKNKIERTNKKLADVRKRSADILAKDEISEDEKLEVRSLQASAEQFRELIELLSKQMEAERALEDEEEDVVAEGEDVEDEEEEEVASKRSRPAASRQYSFGIRTSKKSEPSLYDNAFGKRIRGMRLSDREERAMEQRALTQAGAELGAELVPEGVFQNYYHVLGERSVIRQLNCDVSIVQNTRETPYPIINDTANEASIINENDSTGSVSADPATDELVLGGRVFSTTFTLGRKFIRNCAGNFETELSKMGAQRLAVKQDKTYTPLMIAGATVPTGLQLATATLTYDILIDFIDSMPSAYQNGMVLMGNRKTKSIIKKLKNTSGDNIWTTGVGRNPGDAWVSFFDGVPFIENPYLPDFAASSSGALMLVNPSCFKIQELAGAELLVNPYSLGSKYAIQYSWFHESDGGVIDVNGFKKIAVNAA